MNKNTMMLNIYMNHALRFLKTTLINGTILVTTFDIIISWMFARWLKLYLYVFKNFESISMLIQACKLYFQLILNFQNNFNRIFKEQNSVFLESLSQRNITCSIKTYLMSTRSQMLLTHIQVQVMVIMFANFFDLL